MKYRRDKYVAAIETRLKDLQVNEALELLVETLPESSPSRTLALTLLLRSKKSNKSFLETGEFDHSASNNITAGLISIIQDIRKGPETIDLIPNNVFLKYEETPPLTIAKLQKSRWFRYSLMAMGVLALFIFVIKPEGQFPETKFFAVKLYEIDANPVPTDFNEEFNGQKLEILVDTSGQKWVGCIFTQRKKAIDFLKTATETKKYESINMDACTALDIFGDCKRLI